MCYHPRAVAGRLNGAYARQKFWFTLKGSDVFPRRNRSLNALGEPFARRAKIDRLHPRSRPPFQFRGGHRDLGVREDLRIGLIIHQAITLLSGYAVDEV